MYDSPAHRPATGLIHLPKIPFLKPGLLTLILIDTKFLAVRRFVILLRCLPNSLRG